MPAPRGCPSQRKRKFSRRTRSGCQTCRIRRVKCDEALPVCRNCTSTGRNCDGYAVVQLPVSTRFRTPATPQLNPSLHLGGKTADEKHCFNFFLTRTRPMLVSCFNSELWAPILRLAEHDSSVCHAVIAFSSLHRATLTAPLASFPGRDSPYRNYNGALVHSENGVTILANQKAHAARMFLLDTTLTRTEAASSFDTALIKTFAHMEVQSSYFDASQLAMRNCPTDGHLIHIDYSNSKFHSVEDAKQTLDPFLNNAFRIRTLAEGLLRNQKNDYNGYLDLLIEQHKMQTQLQLHMAAFDEFRSRYEPTNPKDVRSFLIFRLHHVILGLNAKTVASLSEMMYDDYAAEWEETLSLCTEITRSLECEFVGAMPNLVMDVRVTLPLCWMCFKCRDLRLRNRAFSLLRSWPHHEGLNHSTIIVNMAGHIMSVEEEGSDPVVGFIPESARVRDMTLEFAEDWKSGTLVYALSEPEKDQLEFHRRWFKMEL
ncbi:Zn(II)2Cys6 transcription factor domain-containing protein [Aspergillus lucknowensis]|uniref:Zn(2)-C6 fungal-type domain-containing protein n=1 Tax=Aspergillus lucknowensis TaxID=176173 RepID=A0ABR4LSU9_9EURO